jgi:putative tricarboxylic transport membrane protein
MSESVDPPPNRRSWLASGPAHNLVGGSTVAVLGLALLVYSFFVPSPAVPRVIAILIAGVGLAAGSGYLPVRSPRDFYGGAVLVMLTTLALLASADLPGQRGFAFGPGTAPRLFSIILAAIGAAIVVGGVFAEGPSIERYKVRGPALVIIAILGFAAMIRPLGLVPATFLAFMISILGSTEMRWVESLIAAAAMTLGCVLLFVYLLNLPFQLWPRFS